MWHLQRLGLLAVLTLGYSLEVAECLVVVWMPWRFNRHLQWRRTFVGAWASWFLAKGAHYLLGREG